MMLIGLERLEGHAEAGIMGGYELSKSKKPIDSEIEWIERQNKAQHPLRDQNL